MFDSGLRHLVIGEHKFTIDKVDNIRVMNKDWKVRIIDNTPIAITMVNKAACSLPKFLAIIHGADRKGKVLYFIDNNPYNCRYNNIGFKEKRKIPGLTIHRGRYELHYRHNGYKYYIGSLLDTKELLKLRKRLDKEYNPNKLSDKDIMTIEGITIETARKLVKLRCGDEINPANNIG